MKLVPDGFSRKLAEQALVVRKNSPSILFGVGMVSMVGSTVLACRATLKLEEVLGEVNDEIKHNVDLQHKAKAKVEAGEVPEGVTYTDSEMNRDTVLIHTRGAIKVVKLYAPAVVLGGVGIACITKSHLLLKERNAALAAAYVVVDSAFKAYRERVVDRYGEDVDRELRYGAEEVTVIDEETGKTTEEMRAVPGEPSGYARWFDEDSTASWTRPEFDGYNWVRLRHEQNWANDVLKSRGHIFLNEVYGQLGLTHTSAGAIVGWIWDPHNPNHKGDNYVSFGCWDENGAGHRFFEGMNGKEGAILLDFNVDGPIWNLLDERNAGKSHE